MSRGKLVLTDLSLNRHRPWSPTSRGPPEQTTKAENLSGKEVTGEREEQAQGLRRPTPASRRSTGVREQMRKWRLDNWEWERN
ncbi:hypothetical protein F2Q68_00022183 [Brassica cretica]|uniref:Uncharacterized protein n=1 Tax=Brassica cretica TaxID=69181 RepID=A0A8S9FUA5_BRACR|nr:hypothetical protein F2Q68_00022183 [Brassica cretica]